MGSSKTILIVLIAALVLCAVLGYVAWNQQSKISTSEKAVTTLMDQVNEIQKTMVPAEDHNKLVNAIQSLRTTAVGLGQISANERLDTPEQVCTAVKQVLVKQQQTLKSASTALSEMAASPTTASEIDFLVSVVEKEIGQLGVIDSAQAETFAVPLYHMQKVLDGLGYKFSTSIKTTNDAVLKFQADNQLKADGKIGAKTWAKVKELWNAKRPSGPQPSVAPAAQTKPQTQSPGPTQPKAAAGSPAARPSLSSVTTRSSVKP